MCSPWAAGECVPVPLYNLVYHDAIVSPYRDQDGLRGMFYGGVPETGGDQADKASSMRRMAALHARVGRLEMTKHEFLDQGYRKERTTLADGTTVTVDWDAQSVAIQPELN